MISHVPFDQSISTCNWEHPRAGNYLSLSVVDNDNGLDERHSMSSTGMMAG